MKNYHEDKIKSQEYRIIETKKLDFNKNTSFFNGITYQVNPFIDVSKSKKEIQMIDNIMINVKELFDNNYEIKLILKSPYLKNKQKRMIIDDLIRRWEFDYYHDVDEQLTVTLERSSYNPIKQVKRIKNRTINLNILYTLLMIVFLRQFSSLQLLPFMGTFFKYMNTMLIFERYYNIGLISAYLSIFIAMYLIIVKVYFDKVLKYGLSAKGFLIKERDRMLKKLNPNKRKIKKHLCKVAKSKKKIDPFPINQIYNSRVVVKRIKRYGRIVINRVGFFTSNYSNILLFSNVLRLIHLTLILYLLYSFLDINHLI